MPCFCAVLGCSNRASREKDRSFYRVPGIITNQGTQTEELSRKRREKWFNNIARADLLDDGKKEIRVCSDHFISGKAAKLYDTTNPDWIPTVNMGRTKMRGASPSNPQRTVKRVQKRKRLHASTAHLSFHNYNKSLDATNGSSLENGKRKISIRRKQFDVWGQWGVDHQANI
uniref:THAP-type domain-containing protein n=1 Tax=Eptatretus burgeri TaxID=7764 RepID=A0A8C4R0J6_EPTBU